MIFLYSYDSHYDHKEIINNVDIMPWTLLSNVIREYGCNLSEEMMSSTNKSSSQALKMVDFLLK